MRAVSEDGPYNHTEPPIGRSAFPDCIPKDSKIASNFLLPAVFDIHGEVFAMGWMGALRDNSFRNKALLPCLAVLAGAAVLAGCDEHIVIDRDPGVRIQKGMTWAWRPVPAQQAARSEGGRSEGGRRVISRDVISPRDARGDRPQSQRDFPQYADPQKDMVHVRTRIAIEQTLKSKGLTQVSDPAAADFLVDYQVGIQGRRERVAEPVNPPVLVCGYYGCWQSWGYWGPPGYVVRTVHYREGMIVFDLVRSTDNKLGYRATYEKPLDWNGLDQDHVNSGVKKMLDKLKPQN